MKLAIIDYKNASGRLIDNLKSKNIESDTALSWENFESEFGPLDRYDGLLLHADIGRWREYLRIIPLRYPNLKYAIASNGIGEYFDDGIVRVFDFSDFDQIIKYFYGGR